MRASDARQVRAVDDLRMLDPPAPVRPIFAVQPFVGADDLRVGGIANGVRGDLEPACRCGVLSRPQLGVACSRLPVVSGLSA